MSDRRFNIGDELIVADHDRVEFGRVIDRSGTEYRTVFPPDGDRDDAHWCDDEDTMRFVHVEDSAIGRTIRHLRSELAIYRHTFEQLDTLNPDDFKTGQSHLSQAFREVNFRDAFSRVVEIVNAAEAAIKALPANEVQT